MKSLKGDTNEYGGIEVDPGDLPESAEVFGERLSASIDEWMRAGIKLVWLRIPSPRAALIPSAIAQGFEFHHCRPAEVMLIRRLVAETYLPQFATHTIGVGAVVINEQRELLTVLERRDVAERPYHFKLPGGMLEPGEHMADGVVREVLEETSIRTEFQGLISFLHHRGQFGASNIYAVCRLKPLTREIRIDEEEIGEARWIPVDEYLARERIGYYNRCVVRAALAAPPLASIKLDGFKGGADDYEIFVTASAAESTIR